MKHAVIVCCAVAALSLSACHKTSQKPAKTPAKSVTASSLHKKARVKSSAAKSAKSKSPISRSLTRHGSTLTASVVNCKCSQVNGKTVCPPCAAAPKWRSCPAPFTCAMDRPTDETSCPVQHQYTCVIPGTAKTAAPVNNSVGCGRFGSCSAPCVKCPKGYVLKGA